MVSPACHSETHTSKCYRPFSLLSLLPAAACISRSKERANSRVQPGDQRGYTSNALRRLRSNNFFFFFKYRNPVLLGSLVPGLRPAVMQSERNQFQVTLKVVSAAEESQPTTTFFAISTRNHCFCITPTNHCQKVRALIFLHRVWQNFYQ